MGGRASYRSRAKHTTTASRRAQRVHCCNRGVSPQSPQPVMRLLARLNASRCAVRVARCFVSPQRRFAVWIKGVALSPAKLSVREERTLARICADVGFANGTRVKSASPASLSERQRRSHSRSIVACRYERTWRCNLDYSCKKSNKLSFSTFL